MLKDFFHSILLINIFLKKLLHLYLYSLDVLHIWRRFLVVRRQQFPTHINSIFVPGNILLGRNNMWVWRIQRHLPQSAWSTWLQQCGVTQIVCHHNAWVQWTEVKCSNRIWIIAFLRFNNSCTLILLFLDSTTISWHQVPFLPSLKITLACGGTMLIITIIITIITIIITITTTQETEMWLKKEAEKILKYKGLTIEIQYMWNVKTKVIPVAIGATGTISKSFRKYVSNIPGKHVVKELQKTAIMGTAHILHKVQM